MGLREMLAIKRVSDDLYVATPGGSGFLFGGCSLALALSAASKTVEAQMVPKSAHASFLRPGQWGSEITLQVDRWSDGRSFATRQVMLSQYDRPIAAVAASFHRPGEGGDWQALPCPDVPPPETLSPARVYLPERLIEIRPAHGGSGDVLHESVHPYWARSADPIGDDKVAHCAALSFMSDYMVVHSMHDAGAVIPSRATIRTVTHTVWFHREVDAETWLLFGADPVSVTGGRGVAMGAVYSETATLVASFAQEVVIQP